MKTETLELSFHHLENQDKQVKVQVLTLFPKQGLEANPIVIDPMVLLSHGFKKHQGKPYWQFGDLKYFPVTKRIMIGIEFIKESTTKDDKKFVEYRVFHFFHELQLLYFGLYGKNLKLVENYD